MGVAVGARRGWTPRPLALLGDERLGRLAAAGHERAFAVVYERHHQALYRYCRSILRHDPDAQDALQSTFTAAFAALARGERDAPIRPWLFRIAHNEAISALRRRRPVTDLTEATNASTRSVEDQVAERAEIDLLVHDLRRLSERQRSALVMRELSGLSHEEIAIALGTSVGAAKQTIYEARRNLFEFAEGRAMDCDEIRRTISDGDGRALRSRRVRSHLDECSGCALFSTSIATRTAQLGALAPALPGIAAVGLLQRIASGHAAGASGVAGHGASASGLAGHGAGASGLAGAAAGKAASAGLAANALAGVAVVASATVGVTIGLGRLVDDGPRATMRPVVPPATAAPRTHGAQLRIRTAGSAGSPAAAPDADDLAQASSLTAHRRALALAGGRMPGSTSSAGGRASSTAPGRAGPGHKGGRVGAGAGSTSQAASGQARRGNGPPPWAGSGKPPWAGSGKPPWAGSGKPPSAGSGKPADAGAGRPPWAGSGRSKTAGSGAPAEASGRPDTAGPPPWAASGRGAANGRGASSHGKGSSAANAGNVDTTAQQSATPQTSSTSASSAPGGPPDTPPGQAKHHS